MSAFLVAVAGGVIGSVIVRAVFAELRRREDRREARRDAEFFAAAGRLDVARLFVAHRAHEERMRRLRGEVPS